MSVDNRPTRVVANGSVTLYGLYVGRHTLVVHDVAPNCVIDVGESVVTIAAPREEAVIDIHITCTAFGSVGVTVVTTGTDLDATGYRIVVSGVDFIDPANGVVDANGTAIVPRLAAGRHVVVLQGVAANCGASEPFQREVEVISGGTVSIAFTLSCAPATWLAYSVAGPNAYPDIFAIRSNGTGTTRLTSDPATDEEPAWSPDGMRIAFTSNRDVYRAVYVMNEDGSGATRLTVPDAQSYRPTWSPDGSRIAFVSERDGNAEIYVMNRDGTNQIRLTTHPAFDTDPDWSPDGTKIAFTTDRDKNFEIYVMNADGSAQTRVTMYDKWDGHPDWAPDGARLAFSRDQCIDGWWPFSCYPAVFVITPGSAPAEVGVGEDPAWSSDGLRIAVTRFVCDFYYGFGSTACTTAGIGILSAAARSAFGYVETWEPELTKGLHRNPTWQP